MAIPQLYPCFRHWDNQTIWIFSDFHFGDEDLRAGEPNRPTDEEIVRQINSKVGRKDTLIVLGDVGDPAYVRQLRGYKVLICGNHDAGATNYQEVFDEVYTGPVFIGERILLSHEPIPNMTFALNIHGHVHDMRHKNDKYHFNCCAEAINFTPVNFNQLVKSGILSKIDTIHRATIDKATIRKKKRGM